LPASKLVPKFAQDPKRNTAGIRVPENILSQLLLKENGAPIISISAKNDEVNPNSTADDIVEIFSKHVDVAVRSDAYTFVGESSVINMTTDEFQIFRQGAGYEKLVNFLEEIEEE